MSYQKLREQLTATHLVMGIQHMFIMFGATVLLPLLTGLDVGVTLFASGVGTLIFHFVTKLRVPIFLGSSFAFLPPILAVAAEGQLSDALGAIAIAGILYLIVSLLFRFISPDHVKSIIPPYISGSIIMLIGLILAPVAVNHASSEWGIALITFAVAVIIKVYGERLWWRSLTLFAILIAIIVWYLIAFFLWGIDTSSIGQVARIGLPNFSAPTFSWNAVFLTVPIALVSIVEHFGDIFAIGHVVKKDFFKNPGVHKTLLGDGIATVLSACIWWPANTTYSENTGAIAFTGVTNPIIMRIAAIFAIMLAFVPKFSALIGTIPHSVIGGVSLLLFGMIALVGLETLTQNKHTLGKTTVMIIVSTMLVMWVGWATLSLGKFNLSGLGLASIVGIVLHLIFHRRSIMSDCKSPPKEN